MPDPSYPASDLSNVETIGDQERGRLVLPEREERKALEWSPLKESEEWPGREGEEHTTQGKQHMHSGWKKHRMMG